LSLEVTSDHYTVAHGVSARHDHIVAVKPPFDVATAERLAQNANIRVHHLADSTEFDITAKSRVKGPERAQAFYHQVVQEIIRQACAVDMLVESVDISNGTPVFQQYEKQTGHSIDVSTSR